ncbi:MAG TPA: redoxin domain-containing protein [Polyangiaceae bacterium]|jgi:peroxiredoxin Q/BCP|nr:redoxin domain-containing protein [Polyangiaceae bacterium]
MTRVEPRHTRAASAPASLVLSRFAALAVAVTLASCHATSHSAPAGEGSGAPIVALPLDTSFARDPGRLLAAGDAAPNFEGIGHTGMRVRLSQFSDRPAVVYFSGRVVTAEAQIEARAFRDGWMRFRDRVSMVFGVSRDDRVTDQDFATKEELPFLLVEDLDGKIQRAFGVAPDQRVAFVVGKDGKVSKVFSATAGQSLAAGVIQSVVETLPP